MSIFDRSSTNFSYFKGYVPNTALISIMIRFMHCPICSRRRAASYVALLALMAFLTHIWLMKEVLNFVDSMTILFSLPSRIINFSDRQEMKYILLWQEYYLIVTEEKFNIFSHLNCPVQNCIVTENKQLLGDYVLFDAIMFDGELKKNDIKPERRSNEQLYIFTTIESSYNVPACEVTSENFFNWTFTSRLDSDVPWFYFVVTDRNGSIVAPSVNVKWKTSLDPVSPEVKSILGAKKKAAAWLVSHCKSDSFRDEYLTRLQEHLSHYGLKIDVYGKCTKNLCPNQNCDEMIRNDYMFYMAFENSFAEDYVTEKVLHAYDNYAIPIVYGGANYSRFLPPGSYINARQVHPYNLAFMIHEAAQSPEILESYFKWSNLYSVRSHDPGVYHPLCRLCEALHSNSAKHAPPKKNFRIWWNGQNGMKWCLPDQYWNETSKVNIDGNHIFKVY